MTVQQMLYFIEVARTKNFTKAAQNLYISQSAMSHAVQTLESELNVQLFVRGKNTKTVELTVYGMNFLPYCEDALDKIREGEQQIERMKNPMSGHVSVMYSYLNCHTLMPRIFSDFSRQPEAEGIALDFFVEHGSERFEREVLIGKADLAFSCTGDFDGLETCPVCRQKLMIYTSVLHPLAAAESLSLRDIKDEKIIGYQHDSNMGRWLTNVYQKRGLRPMVAKVCHDWSAHMTNVALNHGISISPDLPVDHEVIRKIEIDAQDNTRMIYMLWAKQRILDKAGEFVRRYCLDWADKHGEI